MSRLPEPGPGRPHHHSYGRPGLQASLYGLLLFLSGVAVVAAVLVVT